MRSIVSRGLAALVLATSLSGCMFVQWTDQAFLGSTEEPPNHADREWIGVVVMPLAVTADIATAPFQVIALMVTGDHGIYMRPRRVSSLGEATQRDLLAHVAAEAPAGTRAWGIDANGRVMDAGLDAGQLARLEQMIRSGELEVAMVEKASLTR